MMRASSLRKPARVQKPASVMDGNNDLLKNPLKITYNSIVDRRLV